MGIVLSLIAFASVIFFPQQMTAAVASAGQIGTKIGTEVFGPFLKALKMDSGQLFGPFLPVDPKSQDILARTIWGEARGEGVLGMQAVASSIMNRVSWSNQHNGEWWWGNSVISICQAPWQYSCWLRSDPNYAKIIKVTDSDPQFAQALSIASDAISGALRDVTGGADSYYAVGSKKPSWADGRTPVATIGNHIFYYTSGGMAAEV